MDSVHPKIETRFVSTKNMKGDFVIRLNRKIFGIINTEDLTANSCNLKRKKYYPEIMIVKHLFGKKSSGN